MNGALSFCKNVAALSLLATLLTDGLNAVGQDSMNEAIDPLTITGRVVDSQSDGASGGIPRFAILDSDGNKLATSNHFQSGDNIGFPARSSGQTHFKRMLLETRRSMTDDQINALIAPLKKNE